MPLAFKLQYLDGLKPPATPSLLLGKAVHAALEVVYRHRELGVTLDAADVCRRLVESWGPMPALDETQSARPPPDPGSRDDEGQLVQPITRLYLTHADATPVARGGGEVVVRV